MEVMGVSPVQRLVVPRVLATMFVAVLLNGMVSVVGILGGYFFNVIMQGGTPGAYLSSFSALAQLPDLYVSEIKALIFGFIAGIVAALPRAQPARRPQGRRRRGQPVRRHHLPAAVLREHGPHRDLPADRPPEGRLTDGPHARALLDRSGDQLDLLRHGRCCGCRARCAATPRRSCGCSPRSPSAAAALGVIGGTIGVMIAMTLFTGTVVGLQGYAALNQIGTAGLHRLRLRLLQHPRDRPAGRRPRAVRHRGRRLHRPARRDAHQRGGRRPRRHGRAQPPVPRHHPDHRRRRRDHPAVRDRAAQLLLRVPDDHGGLQGPVARHLRPLLQPVPLPDRRACSPCSRC